ncbi:MAG: HD family phosphohydrolase [Bacteroidetes bacterium]|nr:MAG: HD family phosphohydrolase [Bacteroidota bacterium]
MLNRVIEQMIHYNQNDVKRVNHALKVLGYAQAILISADLDEKSKNIILYTAVLHDIGIKESERKFNSSAWNYQEIEGPPIAEKMLLELNIPADIIKRVCFIIGNHHSYDKINGIDFQIIVEADFLVNIYEKSLSISTIEDIKNNYFKTESGKKLINTMFLKEK